MSSEQRGRHLLRVLVLEILEALPRFEGPYGLHRRSGKKAPWGVGANSRIASIRELKVAGAEVKPWTVHDLRRTAATHMATNVSSPCHGPLS